MQNNLLAPPKMLIEYRNQLLEPLAKKYTRNGYIYLVFINGIKKWVIPKTLCNSQGYVNFLSK